MTVHELLSHLRSLDVRIWADGGRLRYSAPDGAMTPDLRAAMIEHKAGIIAFLQRIERATRSTLPPILPVPRNGELPLSFAQQRLWFLDQAVPGNVAYNVPNSMRLNGLLDIAALKQSLDEIVQRHEVLRTTFAEIEGRAAQVIASDSALSLPLVDLCELCDVDQEDEVQRLAIEETYRPFDLASGPLVRVTLLRLSEMEHVLLFTMHHIISDAWSTGVLWQELAVLYEAFSARKPSPLPNLPVQYIDFAIWQREWLQGKVLGKMLAYWKQQLGGAPMVLDLPTDRPRPSVRGFRGEGQPFLIPETLTKALKRLSREEGCTLFMILLAAFGTLLYRYTGQEDILVGSPVANRNRTEVEKLIGVFANTLILRVDLSGNPSFQELLRRVRETVLDAYTYQDLPFEKLVSELRLKRDLSRPPLFQVMFGMENNTLVKTLELPGLTVNELRIDRKTTFFDVTLYVWETKQGLGGELEYNTDLFNPATISQMLDHFRAVLETVTVDPEQSLLDIPLLKGEEGYVPESTSSLDNRAAEKFDFEL